MRTLPEQAHMKVFRLILFLFWGGLCTLPNVLNAQYGGGGAPPEHDICGKAKRIGVNQLFPYETNLNATMSHPMEAPATFPETCIPTLENDLWYKFQSEDGYKYYTITIVHNSCMSPAGLQSILIRADGCSAKQFQYVGCSSQMTEDTIKLFLQQEMPGINYLIYIDGYDGCVCEFSIELTASSGEPSTRDRYKFSRFFYEAPSFPEYNPLSLDQKFLNNRFTLNWSAANDEDIDFFAIQQQLWYNKNSYKTVGLVKSKDRVEGGDVPYQFTDYTTVFEDKKYCYRIVKINSEGVESFSPLVCFDAQVITSFHVGEIAKTETPGAYLVPYINYQKKQNFDLTVRNQGGEIIKQMRLEKEPERDGKVTINMQEFAPGLYYFKMSNGNEYYEKEFVVD